MLSNNHRSFRPPQHYLDTVQQWIIGAVTVLINTCLLSLMAATAATSSAVFANDVDESINTNNDVNATPMYELYPFEDTQQFSQQNGTEGKVYARTVSTHSSER